MLHVYIPLRMWYTISESEGLHMKMKVEFRESSTRPRWNREICNFTPAKSRVYWWYRGDKELDAASVKTLKEAVVSIVNGMGHKIKATEIKYDIYAGCSCGCSPGFILPIRNGKDIFINITKK
jgi:hypothetical protein